MPTSLSNDGFCPAQSSLTLQAKRKSLPAELPYPVVVDVDVCLGALMSDATIHQFAAKPERNRKGIRLLANALTLNGVAIEIAGSSRPANGRRRLISHTLDLTGARPRLDGLRTGAAAYLAGWLQGGPHHERIGGLLAKTGFWDRVRAQPFSKSEWKQPSRSLQASRTISTPSCRNSRPGPKSRR